MNGTSSGCLWTSNWERDDVGTGVVIQALEAVPVDLRVVHRSPDCPFMVNSEPPTGHSCRCFWAGLQNLLNRVRLVSVFRDLRVRRVHGPTLFSGGSWTLWGNLSHFLLSNHRLVMETDMVTVNSK